MPQAWTDQLWADVREVFDAICAHPFLAGVADGTLPPAIFGYYLAQDSAYLRDYARALALVAAKAPGYAETGTFARHAAEAVAAEKSLHAELLPQLGMDAAAVDAVSISPTTTAYTHYLLAVITMGSYLEGLTAVLPCFWIYQEAGAHLARNGSPDPRYQRWVDAYAGEAFATSVADALQLTNAASEHASNAERGRAARHFHTAARYEWMFWDAAWRQEAWPI